MEKHKDIWHYSEVLSRKIESGKGGKVACNYLAPKRGLKINYLFNYYHLVLKPILAGSIFNAIYFMFISIIVPEKI